MNTRGFTLIELTVALGLSVLVAGLVQRQLLLGQRLARAQAERMAMHDNARAALLVLAAELGGLGRDEITPEASASTGSPVELRSDLLTIAPGAVTYLAARGDGSACRITQGSTQEIVVAEPGWRSFRAPRDTDSLFVFAESDPATAADDAWLHLGVVSSVGSSCPDGSPGLAIRVSLPPALVPGALLRITLGAPVRLAEVMEARFYRAGGKSWLGLRSVSTGEAITPVAGPLADSTAGVRGLMLRYRDADDAFTSEPEAVRGVEIAVVAVTDQPIHTRKLGEAVVDTVAVTTRVALRIGRRP